MSDPNSYQAVGFIALAIFAMVGGVNQVLKLTDRFKGQPPPAKLEGSLNGVILRLNALDTAVMQLRAEFHEGHEQRSQDNDARRRAIYEKIEGVRLELKKDIKDVEEKIGDLPNELIVLLKNTGALRRPQ